MIPITEQEHNKRIGKAIFYFRSNYKNPDKPKTLGITQTALAKRIFVTFQQVQKYEKGMNGMSIQKFLQAVEYLKCDFNQLPLKIWLTNKGVKLEHYDENSNDINKEIDHAEPKEL